MKVASTPFTLKTVQRQALFYALLFTGSGASLPYIPLWFADKGLKGAEIGLILALPLLLRAVTGPIAGLWAERFLSFRTPLMLFAVGGGLLYSLLGLWPLFEEGRFWLFLIIWTLSYSLIMSIGPQMDTMTLTLSKREGFAFTGPRAVGSATFVAANICVGWLLSILGVEIVHIWIVVMALMTALAAKFILPMTLRYETAHSKLPLDKTETEGAIKRIKSLVSVRGFLPLLLAMGLIQAAHAFYYGFSTIIWKAQGLGGTIIGLLWALGVVAEIGFMALGHRLVRRFGPAPLLLCGGALSIVRWAMMALLPPLWLLWPLQILHAFSFAAVYLAGIELIYQRVPQTYQGLAQTFSASYVFGFLTGVSTLASGPIYDALGVKGYGVMAIMATMGFSLTLWLKKRDMA
jgi:MFS transporter, PPP family, 3-phenylpropionic acid transporter